MEFFLIIFGTCVSAIFLFSLVMFLFKTSSKYEYTMREYYLKHQRELSKRRKRLREGKQSLEDIGTRVYWLIAVSTLTILGLLCLVVNIYLNGILETKAIVVIFISDALLILFGIWNMWRGEM